MSAVRAVCTLVNLLFLKCAICQELKLISELNNFFNFDHNVLLLDSSTVMNRFINVKQQTEFIPQTVYIFRKVDENITGLETLTEINSKNTFMIVVPERADFDSNIHLLNRVKEIQRLQINMKIGIFFQQFATKEDLGQLFKWCKEHLVVKIFASTYTQRSNPDSLLNIFSFNPFGPFDVLNVTATQKYNNFFPSLESNFQQHQLRLGRPFQAYHNRFWLIVFDIMNATFMVQENNFTEKKQFFKNGIDILPFFDTQRKLSDISMYPFKMESGIIIVPGSLPYPDFSAYLRNITSNDILGYTLITISVIMLLLSIIRYIKQKRIVLFQSVADVLNLLMNDNIRIKYQRLSSMEACLILPLTFLGFFIVNGFLSNLKSYLTQPVLQPQINTIEDIYRSPHPIFTWSEPAKHMLVESLVNVTKHRNWKDKIIYADAMERFKEQFEKFNTSLSFLVDKTYADIVLRVQKHLNIVKGYHDPRIHILKSHVSCSVSETFLFFERLDEISHRIHDAGLFSAWFQRYTIQREKKILDKNVERLTYHPENNKNTFAFPTFILYGWIVGAIVLVIEIITKNFKILCVKLLHLV